MTSKPISLIVIDDHAIFRCGVVQVLSGAEGIMVVAQGSSAGEAVALAETHKPDILLLDLWMQRRRCAADIELILAASPQTKVVALTASEESHDIVAAMSAGASGYVSKETPPDEMVTILRTIHNGETYLSSKSLVKWLAAFSETSRTEANRGLSGELSPQEFAVLRAVAQGVNNKEAAARIGISAATVKYHLARIFVKLGVRNRVEAAVLARGLLNDAPANDQEGD